jgi:hypothetical protein
LIRVLYSTYHQLSNLTASVILTLVGVTNLTNHRPTLAVSSFPACLVRLARINPSATPLGVAFDLFRDMSALNLDPAVAPKISRPTIVVIFAPP